MGDYEVGRTEKVREIREKLQGGSAVLLSAEIWAGKTVLMDQVANALKQETLRFTAGEDSWEDFCARGKKMSRGLILIDNLERFPGDRRELTEFLQGLPGSVFVLMAGREQRPRGLESLMIRGKVICLRPDFVHFTPEESVQLLLDMGLELTPRETEQLVSRTNGTPLFVRVFAQARLRNPETAVQTLIEQVRSELERLYGEEIQRNFSPEETDTLARVSLFDRIQEELAARVTGHREVIGQLIRISDRSYILRRQADGSLVMPEILRGMFRRELERSRGPETVKNLYDRAAEYYAETGDIPAAARYYALAGNKAKIRELLIRQVQKKPSSGDLVRLREVYRLLSDTDIRSSAELMMGRCIAESLTLHPEESERWYRELESYRDSLKEKGQSALTVEHGLAYLDISLTQRGAGHSLRKLVAVAREEEMVRSSQWDMGFNVAGNSFSLVNGGLDFSRWVPHGQTLYLIFGGAVEKGLGRNGRGLSAVLLAECLLESRPDGEYEDAMRYTLQGLSSITGDLELRCAAVAIQSRILEARGNAADAERMMKHLLEELPEKAPELLRQNLKAYWLWLKMLRGDTEEAVAWLDGECPDEREEMTILMRYQMMLKLHLYILTGKWSRLPLLMSQMIHYTQRYDRPYIRLQLHLLQAMACRRMGKGDWAAEMKEAMRLSERYHLARAVADEGIAVVTMLNDVIPEDNSWCQNVLQLTRRQAVAYPVYMKSTTARPAFSEREQRVYSLMLQGMKTSSMAMILHVSERTVKYYLAEIYRKLDVTSRAEALVRAGELGDIR